MKLWPLLLLFPVAALAQDDVWDDEDWGDDWDDEPAGVVWSGFVEAGLGFRVTDDPLIDDSGTLEELRWRIETSHETDAFTIDLKGDLGYDGIEDDIIADVRNLTLAFSLGSNTDVRVGRQVQTWGTGDLVFLNDLFPKDFVSFFSGRDDEYLKAPGNAVRITHYTSLVNIDFVWTPEFEPDVYLDGERFSFFSPVAGQSIAPDPPFRAIEPRSSFSNGEFALRLFRTIEGTEYALYGYHGFFKQPNALTPSLQPTFAPLTALGASLRRPLGKGLFNAEASWYLSDDDRSGTNPLIPNDQFRLLAGYEWEARPNFTVGLQYYLEWTLDHDDLLANSANPIFEPDERRHLLTNRLTWRTGRDRHTWSLFTFYSPSDRDIHLRPSYAYRHSDTWSVFAGANLFAGDEPQTFFSQLEDAGNAWLRVRFSY
ncbi:MAG: hypothetical protein QNI99_19340 [Woeseiaceae bacterium]|nr:hypothetical protein [Woeseiaceae bacterium]